MYGKNVTVVLLLFVSCCWAVTYVSWSNTCNPATRAKYYYKEGACVPDTVGLWMIAVCKDSKTFLYGCSDDKCEEECRVLQSGEDGVCQYNEFGGESISRCEEDPVAKISDDEYGIALYADDANCTGSILSFELGHSDCEQDPGGWEDPEPYWYGDFCNKDGKFTSAFKCPATEYCDSPDCSRVVGEECSGDKIYYCRNEVALQ